MTWNVVTVAFGDKKYKRGQKFLTRHSHKCNVNYMYFKSFTFSSLDSLVSFDSFS